MAVTRDTSLSSNGPLVECVEGLRSIRKQNLKNERKAPRLFATLEAEIGSCTVSNQTQTVVQ